MGNQSTYSKSIEIPKSRTIAYFDIFHKITSPLMLVDCKHMSLVDLNSSCLALFWISRDGLCLSTSASQFWPKTQQYYQNKTSNKFLKTKLHKSLKKKTKTELVFECVDSKGTLFLAQLSVTRIQIWKNSMYQIVLNKISSGHLTKTSQKTVNMGLSRKCELDED
ncbi:hypothetical protein M0813_10746 [Anaeramoeba flamelloides]|uniref:Uncharacterized protein n=1 Tax=Anaeramoeba flamelloides TaxID=1746091 RepID=A0ABQ8X1K2_9EUKA|nr:hypothetical protein M0813_10746 [Anaeramoeba flamelloides]